MLRSTELIDAWSLIMEASDRAESTIREYRQMMRSFSRWLWCQPGSRALDQTQMADCAGYLVERARKKISASNRRLTVCAMRSFFRWAHSEGVIDKNPVEKLPFPRPESSSRSHGMSIDAVQRLLRAPHPTTFAGLRDRALLQVLWEGGLRRSEAVAMTLGDVDLSNGRIYVRSAKRERPRTIILGPAGIEWLGRWLHRRAEESPETEFVWISHTLVPISADWVSSMVRRYGVACGFSESAYPSGCVRSRIHAHSLRHACATEALRGGADIVSVSRYLGHLSIRSTQTYLDVDEGEMAGISARRPEIW